jgi:hypothetical protein
MELSVELRDRFVSRNRSGEGYRRNSAALKVPKDTVASILKWKKFGTTKTLPKAVRLAKMSNRGIRALAREVTKNPMISLWRWENLPEGQPSLQHSTNQAFMVLARRKTLFSKRHMTTCLEFTKRHRKDSQTMRNHILWSDETKIELFGLNAECHIGWKPGTIPTGKNGGSIMLWGCSFFSSRYWETSDD